MELCEGLRRDSDRAIVHVLRPEVTRLREALGRWRHVVRLQTAHVSAVKALLRAAGLGHLRPSLGTEVGWTTVVVGQPIDPRDLPAPQRAG